LSAIEASAEVAQLEVAELDGGLGLRAGLALGRVTLGTEFELAARFLRAEAMATDGRAGSATRVVPVVRSLLTLEVRLSEKVGARLSLGLETALFQQRFLALEQPVADLGRARPIGASSVIWHIR
jgi:hypothetical protein